MDDVSVEVVKKLPEWYIEIMLPFIIVFGVWVFSRLRRDKQGKLFWYRRSYEERKHTNKLDKISEFIENIEKRTSRLELLDLLSHCPEKREVILNKYDEYKKHGYNSYIDTVISDWKDKLCH
jgi:hypothetical protein